MEKVANKEQQLLNELKEAKIIAIIRGIQEGTGEETAKALIAGGIRFLEITLNTVGALEMITELKAKFGDNLRIGAGTVLDVEMAKQSIDAGAEYIISPNLDEEIVIYCKEQKVPVWPGTMTPSEIVRATKLGASAVKVFPAGALGMNYLKDIRGPLNHITMVATGGIGKDNIQQALSLGIAAVGLGGNLVNNQLIAEKNYDAIRALAKEYVSLVKEV